MTDDEQVQMLKAAVDQWSNPAFVAEQATALGIDRSDLPKMMKLLEFPTRIAAILYPPAPTSGMIEMQRVFMKARAEENSK